MPPSKQWSTFLWLIYTECTQPGSPEAARVLLHLSRSSSSVSHAVVSPLGTQIQRTEPVASALRLAVGRTAPAPQEQRAAREGSPGAAIARGTHGLKSKDVLNTGTGCKAVTGPSPSRLIARLLGRLAGQSWGAAAN